MPTVVDAVDYDDEEEGPEQNREQDAANDAEDTAGNGDAQQWHRRRELNRIAAQKCRRRRKEKALQAQKEVHQLQARNTELKWKLSELTQVKSRMCELVRMHCHGCHGTNVDELLQTLSSVGGLEATGSNEPWL